MTTPSMAIPAACSRSQLDLSQLMCRRKNATDETPRSPGLVHSRELQLVGPVTADEVAWGDFLPGRRLRPAHIDRVGAARVEVAAHRVRCGSRPLGLVP